MVPRAYLITAAAGVLALLAALTLRFKMQQKSYAVSPEQREKDSATDAGNQVYESPIRPLPTPALEVKPWDSYKPLSEAEAEEFAAVETQIRKYLTWGHMDPEEVAVFRQTLFKLGDRAIADLARDLAQLTQRDIPDKAAAEEFIHKIDALGYFADSTNSLAFDAIKALATRPVTWDQSGELVNPLEANITFEMFDLFARFRPEQAAQFIMGIEKQHRVAYFTHYAYGRKLAGKTLEDIDQELKKVFGSPELALN